jgi:hypothetical protein
MKPYEAKNCGDGKLGEIRTIFFSNFDKVLPQDSLYKAELVKNQNYINK